VLVAQNSPACASGVAIATNASVDSAAADTVIIPKIGFISCPFNKFAKMLFWQLLFLRLGFSFQKCILFIRTCQI